MRPVHLIGLFLWRGGLLLVGAVVLLESARWVLRFVELPPQIEVGGGLVLTGLVLVLVSLVAERVVDARSEGDLTE